VCVRKTKVMALNSMVCASLSSQKALCYFFFSSNVVLDSRKKISISSKGDDDEEISQRFVARCMSVVLLNG
jgi:hypothetical protein